MLSESELLLLLVQDLLRPHAGLETLLVAAPLAPPPALHRDLASALKLADVGHHGLGGGALLGLDVAEAGVGSPEEGPATVAGQAAVVDAVVLLDFLAAHCTLLREVLRRRHRRRLRHDIVIVTPLLPALVSS